MLNKNIKNINKEFKNKKDKWNKNSEEICYKNSLKMKNQNK